MKKYILSVATLALAIAETAQSDYDNCVKNASDELKKECEKFILNTFAPAW